MRVRCTRACTSLVRSCQARGSLKGRPRAHGVGGLGQLRPRTVVCGWRGGSGTRTVTEVEGVCRAVRRAHWLSIATGSRGDSAVVKHRETPQRVAVGDDMEKPWHNPIPRTWTPGRYPPALPQHRLRRLCPTVRDARTVGKKMRSSRCARRPHGPRSRTATVSLTSSSASRSGWRRSRGRQGARDACIRMRPSPFAAQTANRNVPYVAGRSN